MLLIVGGSRDHNIARLANAAEARGFEYRLIHTDSNPPPAVDWQPGSDRLTINGETFSAAGTSLFIRYDVFSADNADKRAAFFDALKGWAAAYPQVGLLNRANETLEMSKPRALVLARDCGFEIPDTYITNIFNQFADRGAFVAKPVGGGDYTRLLSDMGGKSAGRPWIVQEKLNYPELRLFRVGGYYFAFAITSDVIDYRIDRNFTMREVEPPADLVAAMEKLTDKLGLDYAAADFKTSPATGRLKFLEVNTMPMFTGYDDVAQGRLSDAICLVLRGLPRDSRARHHAKKAPGR